MPACCRDDGAAEVAVYVLAQLDDVEQAPEPLLAILVSKRNGTG